jgi:hypothetical protein
MKDRRTLEIHWQRLVDAHGKTCVRCAATGDAVRLAIERLGTALAPLGIDVVQMTEALDVSRFHANPLDSNRISIAGKPLESWLGATSGQSRCCSTCGGADCRTLEVDGEVFEAVPAELIIRAGLHAAADMLGAVPDATCCGPANKSKSTPSCCGS